MTGYRLRSVFFRRVLLKSIKTHNKRRIVSSHHNRTSLVVKDLSQFAERKYFFCEKKRRRSPELATKAYPPCEWFGELSFAP